ncbi:MAG: carboxyl-terminal processing protease, partial [Psychroserpens sp.]
YLEENRAQFEGMTSEDFKNNYQVSNELAEEFISYSRFNDTEINIEEYSNQLNRIIKASIGQQLFGSNVFESILNEGDSMILKVLTIENALVPEIED